MPKNFPNVMCVHVHSRMEINYIKAGYTIISSGLQTQLDFPLSSYFTVPTLHLPSQFFVSFMPATIPPLPSTHFIFPPSLQYFDYLHICARGPQKMKIKTLTPNGKMTIEVTTPIQLRIRVTVRDELKSV